MHTEISSGEIHDLTCDIAKAYHKVTMRKADEGAHVTSSTIKQTIEELETEAQVKHPEIRISLVEIMMESKGRQRIIAKTKVLMPPHIEPFTLELPVLPYAEILSKEEPKTFDAYGIFHIVQVSRIPLEYELYETKVRDLDGYKIYDNKPGDLVGHAVSQHGILNIIQDKAKKYQDFRIFYY